jgi:hypothetical protein
MVSRVVWIINSIALQCIIFGMVGMMRAKAEKEVKGGMGI